MGNFDLEAYLAIGAVLMCIMIAIGMKWYAIAPWKSIFISLSIIFTGLLCCDLWFYLENGEWGGKSFFGAIFLAPITFILVSKLLKIPYLYALDFCSMAGCLVFAVLKIDCLIGGCCKGIVLYRATPDIFVRFPSQATEAIITGILALLLLFISKKEKFRGKIYPITLVIYGSLRFILNLFRDDWERTIKMGLLLPLGCIWSLLSITIGLIWLVIMNRKNKKLGNTEA